MTTGCQLEYDNFMLHAQEWDNKMNIRHLLHEKNLFACKKKDD